MVRDLAQMTAAIRDPESKVDLGLKRLIDDMFAELHRHWIDEQVVEVVGVVALFGFLNRWNDTFATPLEDEPLEFAEQRTAGTQASTAVSAPSGGLAAQPLAPSDPWLGRCNAVEPAFIRLFAVKAASVGCKTRSRPRHIFRRLKRFRPRS